MQADRTSVHAGGGDMLRVAAAAGIRGRGHPPGAIVDKPSAGSQCDTPRGDGQSRAEERLAARHANISISLANHAERVRRRDEQGDRPQQRSAAERMDALRRRLAQRTRGGGSASDRVSGDVQRPGDAPHVDGDATGGCLDTSAREAAEWEQGSRTMPTSKGDVKIHLLHDGARIHSDAALRRGEEPPARVLRDGGGGAQEVRSCAVRGVAQQPGGGTPARDGVRRTAADAAASQVAWHTADAAALAE